MKTWNRLSALALIPLMTGLAGCGCLGKGGSWVEDAWGQSCIMPGYEKE